MMIQLKLFFKQPVEAKGVSYTDVEIPIESETLLTDILKRLEDGRGIFWYGKDGAGVLLSKDIVAFGLFNPVESEDK